MGLLAVLFGVVYPFVLRGPNVAATRTPLQFEPLSRDVLSELRLVEENERFRLWRSPASGGPLAVLEVSGRFIVVRARTWRQSRVDGAWWWFVTGECSDGALCVVSSSDGGSSFTLSTVPRPCATTRSGEGSVAASGVDGRRFFIDQQCLIEPQWQWPFDVRRGADVRVITTNGGRTWHARFFKY